ncbi:TlpA disulfide reductase family protein [Pontibacter sp. H259]|uniref:TlpA family protein disulfide reductase n=1 Tax=Pontibacter sp. H259 TaxID=3133421 RepID=UPI0030BAF478
MKLILLSCISFILLLTGFTAQAQRVNVVKFDKLQQLRNSTSDTLYVVNFWATWCGPCIKEMPYFEAVNKQYQGQPVRVVLVSMDAKQDLQKVKNFMVRRKIASDVWLLDEADANTWIDNLEPKWSGAIPATILFNNKRKQYHFVEKELKEAELQALVKQFKP